MQFFKNYMIRLQTKSNLLEEETDFQTELKKRLTLEMQNVFKHV